MLREIQRTGDIFFPEALDGRDARRPQLRVRGAMVDAFIAALPPDYPDRLRRVLLSSSDDLLRAQGRR